MSSKPTVVLVPGAWHGVDGYAGVMASLHAAGYPTVAVPLASVNAPKAEQTLEADVQAIRRAIIGCTSRDQDVVLVCHSYGGVPSTQAVENLGKGGKDTGGKGGVVLLFYCTAFVLPEGLSLLAALGDEDPPWFKKDGDHVYAMTPEDVFYNDMSSEQQQVWGASLRSFSYPMFRQPQAYTGYKHIKSAFLFCTKDKAIPIEAQKGMVAGSGVDFYTETIDTNHSPFLTHPQETANAIRRAAGEKV